MNTTDFPTRRCWLIGRRAPSQNLIRVSGFRADRGCDRLCEPGVICTLITFVSSTINSIHHRRVEADMKREMIERGMSADEITKVIEAAMPPERRDATVDRLLGKEKDLSRAKTAKARLNRRHGATTAGETSALFRKLAVAVRTDSAGTTAIRRSTPAIGSGTARFTEPELPRRLVGEIDTGADIRCTGWESHGACIGQRVDPVLGKRSAP